MADEISGTEGYVKVGGVQVEASKWSANLKTAVIDRTHFGTNGKPRNAAGQDSGTITMSGPYSRVTALAGKGIRRGQLVTAVLGVTANLSLAVTFRVAETDFNQDKDAGSDWSLSGEQYGDVVVAL